MTQTALGAFYTPPDLAIQVTHAAMASLIGRLDNFASQKGTSFDDFCEEIKRVRVLDPTVGSGIFLLAAFRELVACCRRAANRLLDRESLTKSREIQRLGNVFCSIMDNCLYGVDVHPAAVAITRFALRSELSELAPHDASEGLKWHIVHGDSVLGCFSMTELLQGPQLAPELEKALLEIFPVKDAISSTPFFQRLHSACENYDSGSYKPCTRDHGQSVNFACWADSALFRDLCDAASRRMALASNEADSSSGGGSPSESADDVDTSSGGGSPDKKFGWQSVFQNGLHWFLAFPDLFDSLHGNFDVILVNPPWSRLTKLYSKHIVSSLVPDVYELDLKNSNLYSCVFQRMVKLLNINGGVGVLLPQSILNEPEKKSDRSLLLKTFSQIYLYPFSGQESKSVFPTVQQNFVIIVARRDAVGKNCQPSVTLFEKSTRSEIEQGGRVLYVLDNEEKLENFRKMIPISGFLKELRPFVENDGNNALGDLFDFANGCEVFPCGCGKLLDIVQKKDEHHDIFYISGKLIDPYKAQLSVAASQYESPISHEGVWYLSKKGVIPQREYKFSEKGVTKIVNFKIRDMENKALGKQRLAYRAVIPGRGLDATLQVCQSCIIGGDVAVDHNVGTMWLKTNKNGMVLRTDAPDDIYFFSAVMNSFFATLLVRQACSSAFIKQEIIKKWHCPLYCNDTKSPIESLAVTRSDFEFLCHHVEDKFLDLLEPCTVLFDEPLHLLKQNNNERVLNCSRRTREFSKLIAIGARECERMQVTRKCSKTVAGKSEKPWVKWCAPSNFDDVPAGWKEFRKAEIVLNHLVARWYGMSCEDFLKCAEKLKARPIVRDNAPVTSVTLDKDTVGSVQPPDKRDLQNETTRSKAGLPPLKHPKGDGKVGVNFSINDVWKWWEAMELQTAIMQSIKEAEDICAAEENLDHYLESVGHELGLRFSRETTPGDGSCQFAAIAQALTGQMALNAKAVRAQVVSWLRSDPLLPNRDHVSSFAEDEAPNWKAYCDQMARSTTWGNHLTLVAASDCLSVVIHVISSGGLGHRVFGPLGYSNEQLAALPQIYIAHIAEWHYESLQVSPAPVPNPAPHSSLDPPPEKKKKKE